MTRPIELPELRLEPRTTNYLEADELARDQNRYHLTAVLFINTDHPKLLFHLQAALSFIERLDVIITLPREVSAEEDALKAFPATIDGRYRNSGGGSTIAHDCLFSQSRATFLAALLPRLSDVAFCEKTLFDRLFFKAVESFRQQRPFMEVSYFFFFSGLEAFARASTADMLSRSAAVPICQLLKTYGFDAEPIHATDPLRSITHYAKIRNALFHNGALETSTEWNGQPFQLRLCDRLFHLGELVALVVMKSIDFDDGHINWNRWIDRQPFK